jgi:hypothetical protein
MTLLAIEVDPFVAVAAIRAVADVLFVDVGQGFLASVLLVSGHTAVARFDRSLRGHPEEGRILYEAMMATTGIKDDHYFYWDDRLI